jgi:alpha-maltose-1-phosphate synthase
VLMEYMALKKPVIATDSGGVREIVEDQQTGFLVQGGNSSQIKDCIFLLLNNQSLAEKIGQKGYDKLQREFNLNTMGNKFLKLYTELKMQKGQFKFHF